MFDGLTDRFGEIFDKLKKRGALSEEDVSAAMREIRVALLEADVALPVVKDFIDGVKERAVGEEVLRSVTPVSRSSRSSTTIWSKCWVRRPRNSRSAPPRPPP